MGDGSLVINIDVPGLGIDQDYWWMDVKAPELSIDGRKQTSGAFAVTVNAPSITIGSLTTTGALAINVKAPEVVVATRSTRGELVLGVRAPEVVAKTLTTRGELIVGLRAPKVVVAGNSGTTGSFVVSVKAPSVSVYGFNDSVGSLEITVKAPLVSIGKVVSNFKALVINTDNQVLTEYSNYDFISFAKLNGEVLGLGVDGNVYVLGGTDDNGEDIASSFVTGNDDFGSNKLKRQLATIFGVSGNGSLKYNSVRDGETGHVFSFNTGGGSLPEEVKVISEKTKLFRTLGIEVNNVDGSWFRVDSIDIPVKFSPARTVTGRRIS